MRNSLYNQLYAEVTTIQKMVVFLSRNIHELNEREEEIAHNLLNFVAERNKNGWGEIAFYDQDYEYDEISEVIGGLVEMVNTLEDNYNIIPDFEIKIDKEEIFEDGRTVMYVELKTRRKKSIKEIYKKIKTEGYVTLKERINQSNIFFQKQHPIQDVLFNEAKGNVAEYVKKVQEHIVALEEKYPQYDDFTYEFVQEDSGSYYVLKGKGI